MSIEARKQELAEAAQTLIDLIYKKAREDHDTAMEENIISGELPVPETLPEGFHLGYSRIAKYQECPRQFYYSYIEGIRTEGSTALRRGQAYHGVVEELLKYKMTEGKLLNAMKADKLAVKHGKAEKLSESEIYRVIDATRFYYSELYPQHNPIAVEEPFATTRGGIPLTGRIDLVDANGWVIDHKFSYDTWSEQRSRYGCQPMVYQWAGLDCYEKQFPDWKFKGFQYNIIRLFPSPKIQRITVPYMGQEESVWWENEVAIIAKGIISGHFPATPGEKKCSWCSHKKLCQPVIYKIEVDTLAGKSDPKDEEDY